MKFKLVTRKNMGPDLEEVPEKIYAQMVCGDYVPFDEFVEEFTYSRIAVENALDNTPPAAAKTALNHLVTYLLEPLRKFYKSPVAILSGYRSDAVNRLAGGVVASQHRKGEAADCYVAEGPEQLLAALQNSGLPFDQAILYKRCRFLHLSLKQFGRNRMQVLVYMICVICLFPGCGLRRNIRQSEQYGYSDSVVFIRSDSLLLQQHSALHDSLSWELKQIIYLPPDTSGRQPLQSITFARLLHTTHQTDSLTTKTTTQQSRSAYTEERSLTQKEHCATGYRVLILVVVGGGLFISTWRYLARKYQS